MRIALRMVVALVGVVALGAAPGHLATARAAEVRTPPPHLDRKGFTEPEFCSGCMPPLSYGGGPVMATNGPGGVTITPIFWEPAGAANAIDQTYRRAVTTFLTNVAAASGTTSNVFSVLDEYYMLTNGTRTYLSYQLSSAPAIIDTDPFPPSHCQPVAPTTRCVTDAQLQAELTHLVATHGLTADLSHLYAVIFPSDVETIADDGSNSASTFCGYHSEFTSNGGTVVYANLPYEPSGCDAGEDPDGSAAVDGVLSTLTHEVAEALSDPMNDNTAWVDGGGNEVGDLCENSYGRSLGSTSASDPGGTEYNQVINGGRYYLQELFSNAAYRRFGHGAGCAQSQDRAEHPAARGASTTTVAAVFADPNPSTLPAGGTSTSVLSVEISDPKGNGIAGDRVHASVGRSTGDAACGRLRSTVATTDSSGSADFTYVASRSNATCFILFSESIGGQSTQSTIYQGTTATTAPELTVTFPTRLVAGAAPTRFTMTVANPSSVPLENTSVDLSVFGGTNRSPNVEANQVQIRYATSTAPNRFVAMALSGSTGGGGQIDGTFGSGDPTVLGPHATERFTIEVDLSNSVPTDGRSGPVLAFETYLNQYNSAAGTGANLADSYASNVEVVEAATSTLGRLGQDVLLGAVLGAVGALVVVLLRRQRTSHAAW